MKRFVISAAAAAMLLGSAGLAMAQNSPPRNAGDAADKPSAADVQNLLKERGYSNVSALQTDNPDGKVHANAMKDGKPVNLEIDMQTGGIIETAK